ncbi:MAG: tetratricopeptide repeat protein [Chloroflexota bacterium]|nr:tetratricopeptide repeat protein [Chloroflexota bacterium]
MNQTPAQLRNAAARRLMARRRFREALDVLNEAIRADPRFAESYDNRAAVFEALGMAPQADADRKKVADLGGVKRPSPAEEESDAPEPLAARVRQRPAQLAIRYPTAPKRRGGGGGAAMRAAGTILITIGLFIAGGIGIYIALTTISDAVNGDNGGSVAAVTPIPAASGGASRTPGPSGGPTGQPTASPLPKSVEQALDGSPLTFKQAQAAWEAKGLAVAAGGVSTEVTGFATTAVDVTLSKGGDSLTVAVLFYDGSAQVATDWTIGDVVVAKTGHVPSGPSPWANHNAIVVVLADAPTIHADARDAFLGIS